MGSILGDISDSLNGRSAALRVHLLFELTDLLDNFVDLQKGIIVIRMRDGGPHLNVKLVSEPYIIRDTVKALRTWLTTEQQ